DGTLRHRPGRGGGQQLRPRRRGCRGDRCHAGARGSHASRRSYPPQRAQWRAGEGAKAAPGSPHRPAVARRSHGPRHHRGWACRHRGRGRGRHYGRRRGAGDGSRCGRRVRRGRPGYRTAGRLVTEAHAGARAPPLDVFMVAGESSGDQLGVGLMRALAARHDRPVAFRGIGGSSMVQPGFTHIFPPGEIGPIGVTAVSARLPTLLRRLRATIEAIVTAPPDVLVLIDMPDFSLRVARAVRRRVPDVPIVKYVSPSVWVWRSGRAKAMREWVDLVLALLPFQPEVHRRLGGPRCIYVGHPLLARLGELRETSTQVSASSGPPLVLVLPGSRRHEIRRLGGIFGDALEQTAARYGPLDIALPTLPHLSEEIAAATARWRQQPRIVVDEAEKY